MLLTRCRRLLPAAAPSRFHAVAAPTAAAERIEVVFVHPNGSETRASGARGDSVLSVAHAAEVPVEGACEGGLACTTCHVILSPEDYAKFPEPSVREEDLLDMAPFLTSTSRLCCQLRLDAQHCEARFRLPAATRNFYVDGHVPKPH